MENTMLHVLGQAKEVYNVETESIAFLRDPFSATLNDFIVYCISELSDALNLAIVHTYSQLPKKKRGHFYLVGYKERTSWGNLQQKLYDDPSACEQGLQIKWLLKNLRWYWKKYAEYMELSDDAFDDITGFLLFDVVQSAYADCETELKESFDNYLVQDCYQASLDLVIAIAEASYYQPISEEILRFKENLENMLPLVCEFEIYQTQQRDARKELLDTNKVIEFLKSDTLMKELEREAKEIDNPAKKPLTNYFLCTVMPRFGNVSMINDSGFSGHHNETVSSAVNEPHFYPLIRDAMETPVVPVANQFSSDHVLLDSVINQSDDDYVIEAPVDLTNKVSDPLVNTSLDGSMIVINRYESTPNNKLLNRLKKDTTISRIAENEDETADTNKSDVCDGSFVLI